jgi:predicted esterase
MAHGTQDEVIGLAQAERGRDYLKRSLEGSGTAVQIEMVVDAVGHKVGSQGMRALRQWGQAVLAG